jgi:hypothetical protein
MAWWFASLECSVQAGAFNGFWGGNEKRRRQWQRVWRISAVFMSYVT